MRNDTDNPSSNAAGLPPVLIVCLSIRHGGVDVRVRQTALALAGAGVPYSVAVIAGSTLQHELARAGVQTSPIDRRRGDPRIVGDLCHIARRMGAGILDAHNTQSQYWGAVAALRLGIPGRVASTHSVYRDDHPGFWRVQFHEGAIRLCRAAGFHFMAVSRSVESYLRDKMKAPPNRLTLSRNGMEVLAQVPAAADLTAEAGWPADAVVLGMIGRLDPRKGHRFVFEALRDLVAGGERRARLFVAGTGRDEADLRAMVADYGLQDFVHFAGFRSDVPALLGRVDLLLLPSLSEGLPYSVLEAARQGVPTLSSRLEGTEDMFRDGETIFFVPVGDVAAIRQRLQELLEAPGRMRQVGQAAQRMVEQDMRVDAMVQETFAIYRRALGG